MADKYVKQSNLAVIRDWVKSKLNLKQDKGDYATRSELPVVPTNVSDFTNDAGYLTQHQSLDGKQDVLTAGSNITIQGNVISATGGGGEVTAEAIENALGYVPADVNDVPDVSELTSDVAELKEDITQKQDTIADLDTIRAGASAGATALQSVPLATNSSAGIVKPYGSSFTAGSEWLSIKNSSENGIAQRVPDMALTLNKLNLGVKAALSDSNHLVMNATEQATACSVLGAEPKKGEWVLKGRIAGDASDRGNIDTGVTVDLSGCTELLIKGYTKGTGNSLFDFSPYNSAIANGVVISGNRYVKMQFVDFDGGFAVRYAKSGTYYGNIPLYISNNLTTYDYQSVCISDITKFFFETKANVTECNIEIYSR